MLIDELLVDSFPEHYLLHAGKSMSEIMAISAKQNLFVCITFPLMIAS